jgi:hypothetical protein
MKSIFTFLALLTSIPLFACNKNGVMTNRLDTILFSGSMKLKITVDGNTFTALLYNNETVAAFKKRLPLTIHMKELNGNEKYSDLPHPLPANASKPGTIQAGDLMLYGTNTLVLFYKSFATSYNYTKLARLDNPSALSVVLGSGSATVKFELE